MPGIHKPTQKVRLKVEIDHRDARTAQYARNLQTDPKASSKEENDHRDARTDRTICQEPSNLPKNLAKSYASEGRLNTGDARIVQYASSHQAHPKATPQKED